MYKDEINEHMHVSLCHFKESRHMCTEIKTKIYLSGFGIWNISDEMGTVLLPNSSKQTVAFEANSKETPFHFLDSIKLVIKAKLCAM